MHRKLIVIMVGLALLGGVTVAKADDELELELRVLVDPGTTFDIAFGISGTGGAFYVSGTICEDPEPGALCDDSMGRFDCWGWMVDNGNPAAPVFVSQEFNLDGRGKIQTQGAEDEGPRAVVGGTGDFRNVRGEVTGTDFSNLPEFIVTFELTGVDDDDDDSDSDSDSDDD